MVPPPHRMRSGARETVCILLFVCFGLIQPIACPAQPAKAKSPASFRFEPVSDKSLGLWEGDKPVFVYNHGLISSSESPETKPRSTYLHPIYGLDGEILTDDFPSDHRHHRGLYWAWPHIKIGDEQYSLWSEQGIRQEFGKWLMQQANTDGAVLGVENGWFVGDRQVMREEVRIQTHPATDNGRAIDFKLTWTPIDRPITLWGAENKSYGGFTFRFGPRKKTIITVPSGRTSEDLVVTSLPWADFTGDLKAPGKFSGAAIFVHPTHLDYPPTWMTRHYGMLAVGWPGVNPQTFPPDQSFSCRYRIWIHRGNPEAAEIQSIYDAYIAESTSEKKPNP